MSKKVKIVAKKASDPVKFADIQTGFSTKTGLSKTDIQRYNTLYNVLHERFKVKTPQENILWVGQHRLAIEKYLTDHYTEANGLNPNSAGSYYNSLANILFHIDKDKYKTDCNRLIIKSKTRQLVADAQGSTGLLSEKQLQNYASYTDLCAKRDLWIKRWQELRPADKVVIPFKATGKKKRPTPSYELRQAILFSLILACNTYVPPIRKNIEDMKFYYGLKNPEQKTQQNYVWRIKTNEYAIVMNYDKVENSRIKKDMPREIFKLNTEIVDTRGKQITNGKRLSELIEMSLEDFPRDYLLCNLTDDEGLGPMSTSSFNNSLKIIFKPRVPSQNMLRKAYVNYIYNSPDFRYMPYSFLQTVASSMRHTVETAMKKYRKSNAPDDILPDVGPLHDVKIVRTINIPVMVDKKRKSMALIAKNYREKNKEKVLESRKTYYTNNKDAILKRKIINNLNSQAQTQVQKRTIAKYDLKQNPITGEWS